MRGSPHWVPGVIAGIQGQVSYQVQVASRTVWHRHVDNIRDGTQYPYPTLDGKQESGSQVLEALSQYWTAILPQLLPIPDRHSSPTLQGIVTLHKSVNLLTAMDSETMRRGDVVY